MGLWRDVWKEKNGAYVSLVADILILWSLIKRSLWNGDPLRLQTALARPHFIKGRLRILCFFFLFGSFGDLLGPVVLDFIGVDLIGGRYVFSHGVFLSAGLGLVEKELGNLPRFFTGFSKTAKWLITLPETNIAPEIGHPKRKVVFPTSSFKGYVSFREGSWLVGWLDALIPNKRILHYIIVSQGSRD